MKNFKTLKELQEETRQLFSNFHSLPEAIYATGIQILTDHDNYNGHDTDEERKTLQTALDCLTKLTSKTGDCAHDHLCCLFGLTREEHVVLYPLTNMKAAATEQLRELYAVSCEVFEFNR